MDLSPKTILSKLVGNGIISNDEADRYELECLKNNLSITEYLLTKTSIRRFEVIKVIGQLTGVSFVDLSNSPNDPQAGTLISESIARKYNLVPYKYDPLQQVIYVATADPFNTSITDFLEKKTGKKIIMSLADQEEINKVIYIAYSQGLSPEIKDALKEYGDNGADNKIKESAASLINEAPIAKIVSTILEFSIKSRASDIHIEPLETKTRVRYRIDGILTEKLTLPRTIHDALVSRIKILSEMKIDEKRIPQDGRFTFKVSNEEVDLRVSSLPTVYGEKIVMRLLKKTGGVPSLMDLGLRGPQYKDLEESLNKPYGIILVTGPTGSGKTTTLYSILNRLNKPGVNIVTLEDPVEYQLAGINQVQTNPQAGLTFSSGLRAFLRQDPNIILVGEIRDKETTQLAIQAALTGHLVFSTLHTNDSATAIPRLIDLGGEPFLIASILTASIAQRICRKICPYCKTIFEPTQAVKENIKEVLNFLLPKPYLEEHGIKIARGEGCSECNHTGYLGRVAIFELLKITTPINKMILQQTSAKDIEAQAIKEGLITMKQDGYLKVLDKITTIEEILRVAEV